MNPNPPSAPVTQQPATGMAQPGMTSTMPTMG